MSKQRNSVFTWVNGEFSWRDSDDPYRAVLDSEMTDLIILGLARRPVLAKLKRLMKGRDIEDKEHALNRLTAEIRRDQESKEPVRNMENGKVYFFIPKEIKRKDYPEIFEMIDYLQEEIKEHRLFIENPYLIDFVRVLSEPGIAEGLSDNNTPKNVKANIYSEGLGIGEKRAYNILTDESRDSHMDSIRKDILRKLGK